jgi:hypothetical protein
VTEGRAELVGWRKKVGFHLAKEKEADMFSLGTGEIVMLPIILIVYLAPIALAIWVVVTLRRMEKRLEEIGRLLVNKG